MCDIGKAIARAFTPAGTGAMEAMQAEAATAQANADAALTKAINDATQAALPVLDNPSARAANEAQMRATLAARGAAWSFGGQPTASPAIATRQLFGA